MAILPRRRTRTSTPTTSWTTSSGLAAAAAASAVLAAPPPLLPATGASSSVLVFTPGADDHDTAIVCRAYNPNLPDEAIFDSRTLDVHYAPLMTLSLGANLRPSEIYENRDVYLDCAIRANPPTSDVVWHFEGNELQTDKNNGVIVSSNSLVLQRVTKSQRGWYTCSAFNREGSTESNRLFLRVKYAPRCKPGQRRLYGVDLLETAQIVCELDADPPEGVEFSWAFNNTEHASGTEYTYSSNMTSSNRHNYQQQQQHLPLNIKVRSQLVGARHSSRAVINYRPLSEQDYGELLCFGRNEVGMQVVPCVYQITPAAPPQSPENCTQVNATDHGFTVECFEAVDGAWNGQHEQLSYVAELYDEQDRVVAERAAAVATTSSPSSSPSASPWPSATPMAGGLTTRSYLANVTVVAAPRGSSPLVFVFNDVPNADDNEAGYRVHIFAVNRKGRSAVTRVVAHVLNASKYTQAGSGGVRLAVLRPLLGLLLGVIVTVTLIGALAFAVANCHKRCSSSISANTINGINGSSVSRAGGGRADCRGNAHNACVSHKDINKWEMTMLKPDAPDLGAGLACDCDSSICASMPLDAVARGSLLNLNQAGPDILQQRQHGRPLQQQQQLASPQDGDHISDNLSTTRTAPDTEHGANKAATTTTTTTKKCSAAVRGHSDTVNDHHHSIVISASAGTDTDTYLASNLKLSDIDEEDMPYKAFCPDEVFCALASGVNPAAQPAVPHMSPFTKRTDSSNGRHGGPDRRLQSEPSGLFNGLCSASPQQNPPITAKICGSKQTEHGVCTFKASSTFSRTRPTNKVNSVLISDSNRANSQESHV